MPLPPYSSSWWRNALAAQAARVRAGAPLLLLVLMGGCHATGAIQRDLEDARAAYERGRNDPVVVRHASAELERARQALAAADEAWAERRDADETRQLSVLATRRTEVALATAERGAAEERQERLDTERRTGRPLPPQAVRDQVTLRQALQPLQPLPSR